MQSTKPIILLLFLVFISINSHSKSCEDLNSCLELATKYSNKSYISDKSIKGDAKVTGDYEITSDNYDSFISEILHMNGYTRVKINEKLYRIISSRDIRYHEASIYEVRTNQELSIPPNRDYSKVIVNLQNPEIVNQLSKSLRPFMSRYGRIVSLNHTGQLVLMDNNRNIQGLYRLITTMDKKPSKEVLKKWKDWESIQMKKELKCNKKT